MAAGVPKRPVPLRRQETKPRPYFPPTMKAAFFTSGMITMQRDLSNRSRGMPLSGSCMTSRNESVAFCNLLSGVFSDSWLRACTAPTRAKLALTAQVASRERALELWADLLRFLAGVNDMSSPQKRERQYEGIVSGLGRARHQAFRVGPQLSIV